MCRLINIYGSLLLIPLFLWGCSDTKDEQDNLTDLKVICRDMDDPAGKPLNEWSGVCEKGKVLDVNYLMKIDREAGGKILTAPEDYRLVSITPENTKIQGPVSATAWFVTAPIPERLFSLTVNYKDAITYEVRHEEQILKDIPFGEIITKEYLEKNEMLPDVGKFIYSHLSMENLRMTASAEITVWYHPLVSLSVYYKDDDQWSNNLGPEEKVDVPLGIVLTEEYVLSLGIMRQFLGYTFYSLEFSSSRILPDPNITYIYVYYKVIDNP